MTLENISNIDGLFAVINQCTGNVELISDEGDCINLKSRLAQYMTVAGAFSDGYIRSLRLRVEKDEDKVRIFDFILSGEAEKYFSPFSPYVLYRKGRRVLLPQQAAAVFVFSRKKCIGA